MASGTQSAGANRARGQLRVYLGAAPGVGKTYAMLDEGHRRAARGTDVVAAFIETHGRTHTAERIEGLEFIPRQTVEYRGSTFTEMDLAAVLARHPQVALVDELAHTNVPGSGPHEKRWQDIETLLDAGIDVISTVNIQHLESLNDVVEAITGTTQRETVPDSVVRAADQVELVDMTPEALRRRMAHGNIYKADKIDTALTNYFRQGNLAALRELALLWLADRVDEGLQRYREQHGIASTWETRERVVVALSGGPEGETLIRRAARIAARASGGDLLGVHVVRSDGLAGSSAAALEPLRQLLEDLGGSYHSVIGNNTADAVLEFARANNATQVVIGASRRHPLLAGLTGPGTGSSITRRSGSIDVHVVSHDYISHGWALPALTRGLTPRRRLAAVVIGAMLFTLLTLLCATFRTGLSLGSEMLLFLTAVVIVSLIGGFYPAFAAAVVGSLLLNYYFVPPIHTFTISEPENILALVVFVVIASSVSRVVDLAARRTSEAARLNAEAETLSTVAGNLLRGDRALPVLLERLRESFALHSVALLHRESSTPAGEQEHEGRGVRGSWTVVAEAGPDACRTPEAADSEVPVDADLVLALRGKAPEAGDLRVLNAFASYLALAYRQQQLTDAAEATAPIVEADRVRTALLNAVSHDLRTPIASAKAAVSSLRSPDVEWSRRDQQELLADADRSLDRLTDLVTNLLDLSRLQAGALPVTIQPIGIDDVLSRVLDHAEDPTAVVLDVPPEVPDVLADAGLLERAVANLVDNAQRFAPPGTTVTVSACSYADTVELRVIDTGPGIPPADRERVFAAFQRRDDHAGGTGAGVGLGLAIARGFVEAMNGTLTLDDTPGGGLTAVIAVPEAGATPVPDAVGRDSVRVVDRPGPGAAEDTPSASGIAAERSR